MDPVESLLNFANTFFQEKIEYSHRGGEFIEINATREETSDINYTEQGHPQSFENTAFSVDTRELIADGQTFLPRRGDVIRAKDGLYNVVEQDGQPFIRRFNVFGTRITFYAEKQKNKNAVN